MPLYEYECERCGARFELIQRFADAPAETCKTCGGPVHRLLSAPAIQFKGTGWYITDYARKGKGDGAPAGSSPSSSSTASSSGSNGSGGGTAKPASSSTPSGIGSSTGDSKA